MAGVGELVRSTTGQWIARPLLRCPRGHPLRRGPGPGRVYRLLVWSALGVVL
jgi:hypothetical protein